MKTSSDRNQPSSPPESHLLKDIAVVMERAARMAGETIVKIRNSHSLNTEHKSDGSHLTAGDLAAQRIIFEVITGSFPSHAILSEELSSQDQDAVKNAEHLWIIDPIDGTTNYAYGSRQVGISIAYAFQGKVYVGIVFNPFVSELFSAVRSEGALLNDQPIMVGKRKIAGLEDALVATGFPPLSSGRDLEIKRVGHLLERCRDIRRAGACSLDLCDVACGRLDAYYESVNSWDMAAGGLIAREAGAVLLCFSDNKEVELSGRDLLCSRPEIAGELRRILYPANKIFRSCE